MNVLITGITGPVGVALADYLLTLPDPPAVHGVKRWRSDTRPLAHLHGRITLHEADVEDPFAVAQIVRRVQPQRIFHLAAQSYPNASWDAPITTMRVNVEGTINVLEAVRLHCPTARVHVAGSSAAYGFITPADVPIGEDRPLRPLSPYGVSKAAAEMTAVQYAASYGLHTVVTRSFNHVGPYQNDRTAMQSFCRQMVAIERGEQSPVLHVGNLEPRRDYTHARDAVRAMWLLLAHAPPGEVYNVCSGVATRIGDMVAMVVAQGQVPVTVEVDPARLRPVDEPILQGDNRKLCAATGWQPAITVPEIVAECLAFWRGQ